MIIVQRAPDQTFLNPEQSAAYSFALKRDVRLLTEPAPGGLTLDQYTQAHAVVGSVEYVSGVLELLGRPVPAPDYYPDALQPWLKRCVWRSTSGEAKAARNGRTLFVKSHAYKRYTGAVLEPDRVWPDELAADEMPIWLSDPVFWLAEFRIYVIDGQIRAVGRYDDHDNNLRVNMHEVAEAISRLSESTSRRTYAIDFGVLDNGETALVELNDAWAIGRYSGCDDQIYMELLMARWRELSGLSNCA